jgi:hypothetical protein
MAKQKSGIDNGVIASLGKQLTNKVDNGVLTRKQATKVKNQRTLLAKAFGPNWRVKVYGKGGAKSYPTYGYKGPTELNEVRKKALERAKTKLAVGSDPTTLKNGGTEAPWKQKKNRSDGGTTAP